MQGIQSGITETEKEIKMKKRVLCYGDSNTWGCIPGPGDRFPEEIRWTCILQQLLGDEYVIIEEGQNGRTTVWDDPVENRLSGVTYFYPCVESQSPLDLIIIALGVNDLKPRFNCAPGSIADGLNRYFGILKYVPLHGRDPKVLLVSPAHIDPEYRKNHMMYEIFGENADIRSRMLAPEYKVVAERNGAEFLDAALYAKTDPADGIHLDAESHRKLAEAFAEKIRDMLGG